MFDYLSLYIALTPLALYFVLMGLVNLSRWPFVVSGVRDLGVLCLGMTGLIVIGPMELFFPMQAAARFGPFVWGLLLVTYFLIVSLVLLAQRPRINIYNISLTDIRPILSDLAFELDPSSRWAGDSLAMPKLGVQFYLEGSAESRNISLVASRPQQNAVNWRILENSLKRGLRHVKSSQKRYLGVALIAAGLVMLVAVHGLMWFHQEAVLAAIPEMLRM